VKKAEGGRQKAVNLHSLIFLIVAFIATGAIRAVALAAEPAAVEVGLPEDGLFGLGGQYILDKALDRKNGFLMKPRWAGVPEIQRLLAVKAISLGLMTPEAALRANLRGVPIRLLQPYQVPHMQVLVPKDSPYKSVEDLRGKPVALTPEVTTLYNLFDFIMRKRGFNIEKDFQLKKLGGPVIIALLERGEVEAGILWEAHVSRLISTGRYRVIMVFRDELAKLLNIQVMPVIWLGALEPWVRANPDMVPKLRAAWTEAYRGVQRDKAHFQKHAKKFFGLEKPEEMSLGWERTRTFLLPSDFSWPDGSSLKGLKTFLQDGVEMGMFPREAAALIDGMFVP